MYVGAALPPLTKSVYICMYVRYVEGNEGDSHLVRITATCMHCECPMSSAGSPISPYQLSQLNVQPAFRLPLRFVTVGLACVLHT